MAGLLSGQSKRANQIQAPDTAMRIQTSIQGRPRPLVYGQTRIAPNITLATNFTPILGPSGQPGVAGGKGGSGGGKGTQQTTWVWYYFCDIIFSFGSVPIINIPTVWNGSAVAMVNTSSCFWGNPNDTSLGNTTITSLMGAPSTGNGAGSSLVSPSGSTLYSGTYSQTSWPYMATSHPEYDLSYRGEAYLAWQTVALGQQSTIPSLNFEIVSSISWDVLTLGPDANPKDVIVDYLTNPDHGVPSFLSSYLGDLTSYRDYCRATGMLVSIAETSTRDAASFLSELVTMTNANFRWSSGKLDIVPYGDSAVTGNGVTWIPNTTPVYGFTLDDILPNQGGSGSSPIAVTRKPRSEIINHMRMEYLSRPFFYNPEVVDIIDEASVATYGMERVSDLKQAHMFCLPSAASIACALQLQRAQISAQYVFTVGRRFILLDPMDIITLTDPTLGMVGLPARITEMQENSDGTITITAEEYTGTTSAPAFGSQRTYGGVVNFNINPGPVRAPLFMEPPDALANGLEIWIGVCGQSPSVWGGADVFVSYDGVTYAQAATISGPSRMGTITGALPTVTPSLSGPTIDNANVLAVDLSQSVGTLSSGSAADLAADNLLAYVDGELVSYQNATLTSANHYNLSPLSRGAYGSTIGSHASGSRFLRLDDAVVRIPYTQDRIGATLYVKFRSFNSFGFGQTDLSTEATYQYTITGAALSGPLPNVQNVRTVFTDGFMQLWWDEISDFRTGIRYEITKGTTWATSVPVGDVAHPPFVLFGNDTYWINAYCTPLTGLTVQSVSPPSVSVSGNMLVRNLISTTDEQASDWSGTLTNLTASGSSGAKLLSCTVASGSYEIPLSHVVDIGRVDSVAINAIWASSGVPIGQNILSFTDFLNTPDIFGGTASDFITSWVEIAVATSAVTENIYAESNVYSMSNVYTTGTGSWSSWQKFVPGTYYGRYFKFRVQIRNANPSQVTGVIGGFSYSLSVAPRIDHYQNLTIAAGGTTITFQPDGAASPAAFNGGPNGASVPYYNAIWPNSAGDVLSVSSLTKSSMVVQILNGGVGVSRSGFNINVEGY